jgi:hypothetical protein
MLIRETVSKSRPNMTKQSTGSASQETAATAQEATTSPTVVVLRRTKHCRTPQEGGRWVVGHADASRDEVGAYENPP